MSGIRWSNSYGQPLTQQSYTAAPSGNNSRKPNYTRYPGTGLQPGAQWVQQQYQSGLNNITSRMGTLSVTKKRKNRKTRRGGGLGFLGKLGAAFGALGVNAKGIRGSATPTPTPQAIAPTMSYGNIASPGPLKSNFQVLPNGTAKNITTPIGGRRRRRNTRRTRK